VDAPVVETPGCEPCRAAVGKCRIDLFCLDAELLRQFSVVFPLDFSAGVADLQLAVLTDPAFGAGFTITRNGRMVVAGLEPDEVLPHLVTLSFFAVCAAHRDDFLLHAAVLECDGKQLVLPGNTCSGKSTLAARLAVEGWCCCSDELACLDPAGGRLSGLPLPQVLKSGSLDPLHPFYPNLENLPTHRRVDGQLARYLQSQVSTVAVSGPPLLIFPRYEPGSNAELTPLTPAAILERLAEVGSSERPLRSEDVQALIRLAEKAEGYALVFGDLEEAVFAIGERLRASRAEGAG
jgi:hypothetical protein